MTKLDKPIFEGPAACLNPRPSDGVIDPDIVDRCTNVQREILERYGQDRAGACQTDIVVRADVRQGQGPGACSIVIRPGAQPLLIFDRALCPVLVRYRRIEDGPHVGSFCITLDTAMSWLRAYQDEHGALVMVYEPGKHAVSNKPISIATILRLCEMQLHYAMDGTKPGGVWAEAYDSHGPHLNHPEAPFVIQTERWISPEPPGAEIIEQGEEG